MVAVHAVTTKPACRVVSLPSQQTLGAPQGKKRGSVCLDGVFIAKSIFLFTLCP